MNGAALGGTELRRLKSLGQHLRPVVFVGKEGLTDAVVATAVQALADHELIKVKLEAWKDRKKELAAQLSERTGSQVVQRVGHVVVLYRGNPDPAKRKLSRTQGGEGRADGAGELSGDRSG
ncbi:MAG: YhbY family RNA-binding protein [Verrucomicrobiae bacterium]|nr:YhbY family RNA-binding protein [Verrucomicrobiae bacterium]